MKQKTKGIERLFRLIGRNQRCDYQYGFFTSEESPDCFFRISFNEHSFLYRLGIAPELDICADGKEYNFPGLQDYDDKKNSWFFPISDNDMMSIAKADCIKSIIIQTPTEHLNLNKEEASVWKSFFLAGVAECIEEVDNARQLEDFYIQRCLAEARFCIMQSVVASPEASVSLAAFAVNPHSEAIISQALTTRKP